MKKLTILFAGLFITAFSFGQVGNVSTVDIEGDDNITQTNQLGNNNESEIDQFGDFNDAYVTQEGDENMSSVLQNVGNGGSMNGLADVDQTGDKNSSKVKQGWGWHNKVYVDQVDNAGIGNTSAIEQNGTSNYAEILQSGHGNVLHNSKHGSYDPEFAFQRGASTLYLHQQGYDNDAGVYQDYDDQYGDIYQYGYRNHADLTQTSPDRNGNNAVIEQTGYRGLGYGNDNWSEVWQKGSFNEATIKIKGDENGFGTTGDLWTDVEQVGDNNEAIIEIWGDANDADIFQDGNNDKASVASYGDYNEFNMTQVNGDQNHLRIESGGDYNDVEFYQDGYKNQAYINMRGTGPGTFNRPMSAHDSDHNEVDLTQTGSENLFSGFIAGDYNDVDVMQTGSSNVIGTGMWTADGINILGDHNDVDVMQTGTSNSAFVNVTGNNNTSSTIQH